MGKKSIEKTRRVPEKYCALPCIGEKKRLTFIEKLLVSKNIETTRKIPHSKTFDLLPNAEENITTLVVLVVLRRPSKSENGDKG